MITDPRSRPAAAPRGLPVYRYRRLAEGVSTLAVVRLARCRRNVGAKALSLAVQRNAVGRHGAPGVDTSRNLQRSIGAVNDLPLIHAPCAFWAMGAATTPAATPAPAPMPPRSGDEILRTLAAHLFELRTNKGLNQADVARAIEKARAQTVGDWEAGKQNFGVVELCRLADFYNVSVDWLLGRSKQPEIPPGHCVVDLEVERVLLSAKTTDEVQQLVERAIEDATGGVRIGFRVPSEFEVVPSEEFDAREESARKKVERLSPSNWLTRLIATWQKRRSQAKRTERKGNGA